MPLRVRSAEQRHHCRRQIPKSPFLGMIPPALAYPLDDIYRAYMNIDDRAQLIEDIDRSANLRKQIAEQARLSKEFNIAAAFKDVADLDTSIATRLMNILDSTK
jgi:hypothetical protein